MVLFVLQINVVFTFCMRAYLLVNHSWSGRRCAYHGVMKLRYAPMRDCSLGLWQPVLLIALPVLR
jgi:hypothetical protein